MDCKEQIIMQLNLNCIALRVADNFSLLLLLFHLVSA